MSDRPLPDDLSLWPDDPHDLLGITPEATPRQVRQAYNRLIRIYKPEQAPEPFRRIREAYESALRLAELFGPVSEAPDPPAEQLPWPAPGDEATEPDEEDDEEELDEDEDEDEDDFDSWDSEPEDELDELWELAIQGRPGPAYERLVQLNQQYAGRTEVYLRLYWLLTLYPELDGRRVPVDWLTQGLLATGHAGPLRQLYAEELEDDPAEALGERFERLLESTEGGGTLADLMERRFQAAVRLRRWDILGEDLRRLRQRFGVEEDELWLRLLFGVAGQAAWVEDAEAAGVLEFCRREIARHEHLASGLSAHFDRFDLLLEASQGWHRLYRDESGSGLVFLRLLAASWHRPFGEVRGALVEVLESISAAPYRWLDFFDRINQRASPTLALLGELLDQLEQAQETGGAWPRGPDELGNLVRTFLASVPLEYERSRRRVLTFCLREAISPEEMAETANNFGGDWAEVGAVWAEALLADWPLRYVYRANRLFWC